MGIELFVTAARSGMKTLRADELAKAAAWLTGIDKLYRLLKSTA